MLNSMFFDQKFSKWNLNQKIKQGWVSTVRGIQQTKIKMEKQTIMGDT